MSTSPPPFQVEVINHTDWLAQWLPAITSVTGACLALGGVAWSIISADRRAREREYLNWKRHEILRLGTEALEASIVAARGFSKFANRSTETEITKEEFDPAQDAATRIQMAQVSLRLLEATDASDKGVALREAVMSEELREAAFGLFQARRDAEQSGGSSAEAKARWKNSTVPLSTAQGEFNVEIAQELRRLKP